MNTGCLELIHLLPTDVTTVFSQILCSQILHAVPHIACAYSDRTSSDRTSSDPDEQRSDEQRSDTQQSDEQRSDEQRSDEQRSGRAAIRFLQASPMQRMPNRMMSTSTPKPSVT